MFLFLQSLVEQLPRMSRVFVNGQKEFKKTIFCFASLQNDLFIQFDLCL